MHAIDYATHTRRAHDLRSRAIDAAFGSVFAAIAAALAAPFRFLAALSREFAARRRGTRGVQHC